MKRPWIQSLLWTASALLLLAAVALLTWSMTVSTSAQDIAGINPAPATKEKPLAPLRRMSIDELAPIWQVDVRQPLGPETPTTENQVVAEITAPPEPVPAPPAIRVRLVATAIDSQQPCAIFYDEQQRPIVRKVGELVDGVRLGRIERRKVTLEHASGPIDLTVPELFPSAYRNVP